MQIKDAQLPRHIAVKPQVITMHKSDFLLPDFVKCLCVYMCFGLKKGNATKNEKKNEKKKGKIAKKKSLFFKKLQIFNK